MFTKPMLALSISAAVCGSAFAHEEFRQHDAHVHGQVELNIAQDAHDLLIEITAPGADVVGFEHAPKTDAETQRLNQALENLNTADALFTLSERARCHLETASVHHTLGGHDDHDHDHDHDHDQHDDHDHAQHQAHDDHEHHDDHDHDHDHDGHDHHDHQHGSFTVQYQYHCDQIQELKQIDTHWFQLFPSTQKMDVNLLTDTQQTATELRPGQTRISL
ncbi:zinc uptake protein ZrgA [Vibrio furnissii]|uniref:zinc uptake protein ZrgA n=1 Tax=Vibrio furnissii TaxID=29494 RepID=UPI000E038D18|nr:DUF2796 domain-containing protein [Vibrio furnissii]MCG6218209.1 DUF2796 domain-containing protein [Vibrio furnissii]QDC91395.1 DUF2796 domain-containing protein [Vibrio furnissii]UON47230.1 DUF2796 domain-containing protein [Vibrio furnissii]SUP46684.1 zinc-binding protein [Vibrio furnissii]